MNQDGQVLQDSQGKPKRVVLGEDGRTIFGDMLHSICYGPKTESNLIPIIINLLFAHEDQVIVWNDLN